MVFYDNSISDSIHVYYLIRRDTLWNPNLVLSCMELGTHPDRQDRESISWKGSLFTRMFLKLPVMELNFTVQDFTISFIPFSLSISCETEWLYFIMREKNKSYFSGHTFPTM